VETLADFVWIVFEGLAGQRLRAERRVRRVRGGGRAGWADWWRSGSATIWGPPSGDRLFVGC